MSLLMIPGPIEISPRVLEATSGPPLGHTSPAILEAFGSAIEKMREVWMASADAQPFVIPGSGSIAMEMAANNVVAPGERALIVGTGYFSDRMAEMLRRRGARVTLVGAPPGDAPSLEEVGKALAEEPTAALFVTHVDTSTGVRTDARAFAALAKKHGVLSVFDGVCATGGERFEMESWGADVYLTASQKALGLPPGLGLLMVSPRALEARKRQSAPPPLALDFESWLPIMRAYEERKPSYFATPPTPLIRALPVALGECLDGGIDARFQLHAKRASEMRAAFRALGLSFVPKRDELTANTLSAIYFPPGVGPELVSEIAKRGVTVAGGLHPDIRTQYFRVGHMGHVLTEPALLEKTVRAVGDALVALGHHADVNAAVRGWAG